MFLFLSRDTDRDYAIVSYLSVRPSATLVHVYLRFSVSVSWSYSFEFVKQALICSKGIIMKFEVELDGMYCRTRGPAIAEGPCVIGTLH